MQTASFIILTTKGGEIIIKQDSLKRNLENKINTNIDDVKQELRFNVDELGKLISQQQTDVQKEIDFLKSSKNDFSGIVSADIKSVVSVTTDKSAGSGFFVNSEGYIVTNQHVIDGGTYFKVLDYDGNILDAKVISQDSFSDLALLKVDESSSYLKLEDSDNIEIGEKVIAIGNPLGLSFTVTEGIVSAVDRLGPNGLNAYVQTDVTLNPGNSGGPLINKFGKVIGLNNFKIGNAESLGFALESNYIKKNINDMANETIIN